MSSQFFVGGAFFASLSDFFRSLQRQLEIAQKRGHQLNEVVETNNKLSSSGSGSNS